jgi:hypothetical protein
VPRKLLFWAEQQQVAIPGWLREDQKEGLHQEEHFASRKQPRYPTTKADEAKKEEFPDVGGGGLSNPQACLGDKTRRRIMGGQSRDFVLNSLILRVK